MSKIVVITGASSGIGAATARKLVSEGNKVVLAARRKEKLETLAKELGEDNCLIVVTDVTSVDSVKNLMEQTISSYGKIDVLINNAGLGYLAPIDEGKLEDWHRTIDVNVKGLLSCVHSALPELLKSKGHIFNIASVAAHEVFPNATVYCASKWAVNAVTIGIRKELRDKVKVTNISPGTVVTEFFEHTNHPELSKSIKEDMNSEKRDSYLQAEDIADAISDVLNKPSRVAINEVIIRPNV